MDEKNKILIIAIAIFITITVIICAVGIFWVGIFVQKPSKIHQPVNEDPDAIILIP